MPEICRFLGVVVKMFFDDHNPPHFHAEYGDHRAQIDIQRCCVLGGSLPPRVTGLVIEWATLHQDELMDDWRRGQSGEKLLKIAPLE